jgi:uncharacterized protein (TIGR03905 family)
MRAAGRFMMRLTYIPKGVCATRIDLEVENGVVQSCLFTDGCEGNAKGISRLAMGRRAEELIPLLEDITCDGHNSCPAQLALALRQCLDVAGTERPEAAR